MKEWFFVSVWLEKNNQEIHYEITNEDGEQYFFWISAELVNEKISKYGNSAIDRFYYAEEDMLSLSICILDEEIVEQEQVFQISKRLYERYY